MAREDSCGLLFKIAEKEVAHPFLDGVGLIYNLETEIVLGVILAHHNPTIAMASDFLVNGARLPKLLQKEGVLGSEIAGGFIYNLEAEIVLGVILAHQNRTIAIASDLGVNRAKSPEFLQKEGVLGSEIAA